MGQYVFSPKLFSKFTCIEDCIYYIIGFTFNTMILLAELDDVGDNIQYYQTVADVISNNEVQIFFFGKLDCNLTQWTSSLCIQWIFFGILLVISFLCTFKFDNDNMFYFIIDAIKVLYIYDRLICVIYIFIIVLILLESFKRLIMHFFHVIS